MMKPAAERLANTASPAEMASKKPALHLTQKAFGYLMVGGLAAVVDIGLFHLLAAQLGGIMVPAMLSFGVAAVVNYSLSSVWVYRRRWQSPRRAALFLALSLVGLCINAGATWYLAHTLTIMPTLAKVGGVGIAFIANFLMNTFIVFKAEDADPHRQPN